jgi:hypothetical protein
MWKVVQQAGRIGRQEDEQAVYITVRETRPGFRGDQMMPRISIGILAQYNFQFN